jgi:hypothetical protein
MNAMPATPADALVPFRRRCGSTGDLWEGRAGCHNLANAARRSPTTPRRSRSTCGIRIYSDYGDVGCLLEDVAVLAALTGDPSRAFG